MVAIYYGGVWVFDKKSETKLTDIREYNESIYPYLYFDKLRDRWILLAENEGGYNATYIDLFDVVDWIDENREEIEKYRS